MVDSCGLIRQAATAVAAAAVILVSATFALTPDGVALLEMKSSLNYTKQRQMIALGDWKGDDHNPCNWTGITCHLPHLTVRSIDLPYMQLGGIISPSVGKLRKLQRLALHRNNLHGTIPPEIANCTDLRALYLRENHLQGSIPPQLGHLTQLVILDLSSNSLKGTIPSAIAHLTHLRFLNLSANFLSGEIPYFGALSGFPNTSFMGNVDLCGHPIYRLCRSSLGFPAVLPQADGSTPEGISERPRGSSHYPSVILITVMSIMGFGVLVLLFFLWICLLSGRGNLGEKYVKVNKQHAHDFGNKFTNFHGDLPYLSCDIFKRIEMLNEDDVIGSGGYGTVYKMLMNDYDAFAVKQIDRSCELSDKIFEKELQSLGSIKHINIAHMRGYCRLPTAKFIIYDYFPIGSLYRYLHEYEQDEQPLNWNARLRIAVGCARGLAYLHHDCYPPIVHGNIKSSNILLDRSLQPHVSDFGLSKCLVYNDRRITTVVAGTFGYLAPEYLNDGIATAKSDIYGYGIILLELVTGKKPSDMLFLEQGFNIIGWISTMGRENLLDVVDKRCGYVDSESLEVILDIVAMCTDPNPQNRPCMGRVSQLLEEATNPCPTDFFESQLEI